MSTQEQRLLDAGYEGVVYMPDAAYDDALLGVTEDGRAVYAYEDLIAGLMEHDGMSSDEAAEWIDYNILGSLPMYGSSAPIIVYRI
ncbi:MAG: hypothetical protein IJI75_03455 [Solobacterium sp.]|nr:hypothetical protein [Solobacterium sp.]